MLLLTSLLAMVAGVGAAEATCDPALNIFDKTKSLAEGYAIHSNAACGEQYQDADYWCALTHTANDYASPLSYQCSAPCGGDKYEQMAVCVPKGACLGEGVFAASPPVSNVAYPFGTFADGGGDTAPTCGPSQECCVPAANSGEHACFLWYVVQADMLGEHAAAVEAECEAFERTRRLEAETEETPACDITMNTLDSWMHPVNPSCAVGDDPNFVCHEQTGTAMCGIACGPRGIAESFVCLAPEHAAFAPSPRTPTGMAADRDCALALGADLQPLGEGAVCAFIGSPAQLEEALAEYGGEKTDPDSMVRDPKYALGFGVGWQSRASIMAEAKRCTLAGNVGRCVPNALCAVHTAGEFDWDGAVIGRQSGEFKSSCQCGYESVCCDILEPVSAAISEIPARTLPSDECWSQPIASGEFIGSVCMSSYVVQPEDSSTVVACEVQRDATHSDSWGAWGYNDERVRHLRALNAHMLRDDVTSASSQPDARLRSSAFDFVFDEDYVGTTDVSKFQSGVRIYTPCATTAAAAAADGLAYTCTGADHDLYQHGWPGLMAPLPNRDGASTAYGASTTAYGPASTTNYDNEYAGYRSAAAEESTSGGLGANALIGIVAGGVVLLLCCCGALVAAFVLTSRRRSRSAAASRPSASMRGHGRRSAGGSRAASRSAMHGAQASARYAAY